MKKITALLATAAIISTSSFAQEINFDIENAYVGTGLALEKVSGLDVGVALVLNGGLAFMELGPGKLAAEGEITYSLLAPSEHNYDLTVMNVGTYGAYIYDINDQFFVKGRAGLVYTNIDTPSSRYYYDGYSYSSNSYDDGGIGVSTGVTGGFNITEQFAVTTGLNIILNSTNLIYLSAGAQYNF